MVKLIEKMRKDQDSIGGVAEIVARNVPAGLGEPVFDKLKADLGKALFSLPAVLGVEYGAGFAVATARGSDNNDAFETDAEGVIRTRSNRHGGMLGGISSGMPIVLRAAVKPTSSLPRSQDTVTSTGDGTTIRTTGRHDPVSVAAVRSNGRGDGCARAGRSLVALASDTVLAREVPGNDRDGGGHEDCRPKKATALAIFRAL